eukprot:snap_masked-scaffold_37-processed-gene-0.5-mRNA-1 protein AED:1.00 eAED:1.00 QI:0/-1/0/0/-1/1/1/0/63
MCVDSDFTTGSPPLWPEASKILFLYNYQSLEVDKILEMGMGTRRGSKYEALVSWHEFEESYNV